MNRIFLNKYSHLVHLLHLFHLFIHLFIHLFLHSFIHSFIYLFIHWFTSHQFLLFDFQCIRIWEIILSCIRSRFVFLQLHARTLQTGTSSLHLAAFCLFSSWRISFWSQLYADEIILGKFLSTRYIIYVLISVTLYTVIRDIWLDDC